MQGKVNRDVVAEEIAKFQGTWQQTASEIDGVKNRPDEFGFEPRVTFAGNNYVVARADGDVVIKGQFRVYPTQTPKAIDWIDTFGADAGKTLPAIYSLEDNQLVFCAADQGQPRPSELCAGPGQVLRIHRRVR